MQLEKEVINQVIEEIPTAELVAELKKRDYIDSHRDFAPLKKASDAIELDTSNMSIEEVVNEVLNIINKKVGEINE